MKKVFVFLSFLLVCSCGVKGPPKPSSTRFFQSQPPETRDYLSTASFPDREVEKKNENETKTNPKNKN